MTAGPAAKVPKRGAAPRRTPSKEALRAAASLSTRLHRPTRVRFSFIRNEEGVAGTPPLAQLLRGGRGGEVRLKLLLGLLWAAGGGDERHMTNAYPARAWATLLDLPDPEGNGQRRIRDATQWLEAHGFIRAHRQAGKPTVFEIRREDGSGLAYTDPAAAISKIEDEKERWREFHVTLPEEFWTDGWAVRLSGRALAILLVIGQLTYTKKQWDYVRPRKARERYTLSEDTWSRGVAELKAHGIVKIRRVKIADDVFELRRVRNEYGLTRDDSERIVFPRRPKQ